MFDLSEWKHARINEDRTIGIPQAMGRDDVTVVAYVFGSPERMPAYVESIELSLRETYRW